MSWMQVTNGLDAKEVVTTARPAVHSAMVPSARLGGPQQTTGKLAPRKPKLPKPSRPGKPRGGWRDVTIGQGLDYGKRAWELAKYLASLINVEDKKFDVDGSAGISVTTTPTVINLSNVAQGADYYQRDGDSILGQAIEFRGVVAGSNASTGSRIRIIILADRNMAGTDPVLGDVLQGGTEPTLQPMNVFAYSRFEILYDEIVQLASKSTNVGGAAYIADRQLLPVLTRKWNKHVRFQGTTGADANLSRNALFLMVVSDEAVNAVNLKYTFRLHFTDN